MAHAVEGRKVGGVREGAANLLKETSGVEADGWSQGAAHARAPAASPSRSRRPWIAELLHDPEVMRFVARASASLEEARALAKALVGEDRRESRVGLWAVEDRATSAVHGWASLKRLEGSDEIEVGLRLRRGSWGRGIATEAGARLLGYGFKELGLRRIVGVAQPKNAASIRVLQKLGFTYERTLVFDGVAWDNFSVSREVWEQRGRADSGAVAGSSPPMAGNSLGETGVDPDWRP